MTFTSIEEQRKQSRLRKVYIQLRIPRVTAEIAAITKRKKAMKESGGNMSKEVVEELVYSNQHIVALRNELESLQHERNAVLQSLADFKSLENRENLAADLELAAGAAFQDDESAAVSRERS